MNFWAMQINALPKVAATRDKYAGLTVQKKLAAEKLDMVERTIADGFTLASHIAHETGINQGSIHSYLRVLETTGRITSKVGKNRIKTFSVSTTGEYE